MSSSVADRLVTAALEQGFPGFFGIEQFRLEGFRHSFRVAGGGKSVHPGLGGIPHGRTDAFAAPVRVQETERHIKTDAIRLIRPPDTPVGNHLPIDFSEEHVSLRVAVFQVTVLVGNVFHRGAALHAIDNFAGGDQCSHRRIIGFAAEAAEDQPRNSRSVRNNYFSLICFPFVLSV